MAGRARVALGGGGVVGGLGAVPGRGAGAGRAAQRGLGPEPWPLPWLLLLADVLVELVAGLLGPEAGVRPAQVLHRG